MDFRFQEFDPYTGMITRYHVDDSGKVGVQRINPAIHDIVDRNKELLNNSNGQRWGDSKIFASVPLEIVEKELWQAIKEKDTAYLKRWFNNSENRDFRRFGGNV